MNNLNTEIEHSEIKTYMNFDKIIIQTNCQQNQTEEKTEQNRTN